MKTNSPQTYAIICLLFWRVCSVIGDDTCRHLPVVINTWPFTQATDKAWEVISSAGSALDAVEAGCSKCEELQCDGSVGYGNHPDESGETTLDAMIMDGTTFDVGAVGDLHRVKSATSVARAVMEHTEHTLLVGEQATKFAKEMGFKIEDLHTNSSISTWKHWKANACQPNYWRDVLPDPKKTCGPYKAKPDATDQSQLKFSSKEVGPGNHDTIGMVVVDENKGVVAGTSTNGMTFKIPGRVGDSPIMGAGAYADSNVGGAAATGDGDVMMRFLPSFLTVELMRMGWSPSNAAAESVKRIARHYPKFVGAVVAITNAGNYGAACHNLGKFHFSVRNHCSNKTQVLAVRCL